MRVLITSLIFITLVGCVSAPYRDDYTSHINVVSEHYRESDLRFSLADGDHVDIRGIYPQDDSTGASPIMYQGGAGLAGLVAQIGTHASIINSQRNTKLAEAQVRANEAISPLITTASELNLTNLVAQAGYKVLNPEEGSKAKVNIKPIFFASRDMNQLSLNLVVWIDGKGGSEGTKPKYQNLIQVFSPKLSGAQRLRLVEGDEKLLSEVMLPLIDTSLAVVAADLAGKYAAINRPDKTHLVEKHFGKKVVRGAVVDNKCDYVVIRDLRSWFIAHVPEPMLADSKTVQSIQTECLKPV